MPKRMIRDWTDSDRVNAISAEAERLFTRLIMKVDDYGRYTADPKKVRAFAYPLLLDKIREADVERWIAECAKAGLVVFYTVEEKQYLAIVNFDQRLKHSVPKYPPPSGKPSDWKAGYADVPGTSGNFRELPGTSGKSALEEKRREEKKKGSTPEALTLPPEYQTPEFMALWTAWLEVRAKKRLPSTDGALRLNVSELQKRDYQSAIAMLTMAVKRCWGGIDYGWLDNACQNSGGGRKPASEQGQGTRPRVRREGEL